MSKFRCAQCGERVEIPRRRAFDTYMAVICSDLCYDARKVADALRADANWDDIGSGSAQDALDHLPIQGSECRSRRVHKPPGH